MGFPTTKTNAVDTLTEIVADLINNLENKVGIDASADTNSLDYKVNHHKARHEDGGADEISVMGLSGLLGDSQTPLEHKTSHQNGGADEISVDGLAGQLAEKQDCDHIQSHDIDEAALGNDKMLVYKITGDKFVYETKGTPGIHAPSHQDAGGDEIDVSGLSGILADAQNADHIQGHIVNESALANDKILVYKTSGDKFVYENKGSPAGHHESHELGGGDEIDTTGLAGAGGGDFLVMQVFS